MSSTHEHQVEEAEAGQESDEPLQQIGPGRSSTKEDNEPGREVPAPGERTDPNLADWVDRFWNFLGWSLSVFLQRRIQCGGFRF
jgi:hypothetical protein